MELKLKEGNIGLILDGFDDIFSDFDPRSYSEKTLSDDFLNECRKAARDKKDEELELRLLLPKSKRNYAEEFTIKKRLKSHFLKHYQEKHKETRKIKREGFIWFFIGSIIMLGATFMLNYSEFIFKYLVILSEPAGWFMFWEGLGKVFISSKAVQPELDFYKKMSHAKIVFNSY